MDAVMKKLRSDLFLIKKDNVSTPLKLIQLFGALIFLALAGCPKPWWMIQEY
jgi:hypothetical protein